MGARTHVKTQRVYHCPICGEDSVVWGREQWEVARASHTCVPFTEAQATRIEAYALLQKIPKDPPVVIAVRRRMLADDALRGTDYVRARTRASNRARSRRLRATAN